MVREFGAGRLQNGFARSDRNRRWIKSLGGFREAWRAENRFGLPGQGSKASNARKQQP